MVDEPPVQWKADLMGWKAIAAYLENRHELLVSPKTLFRWAAAGRFPVRRNPYTGRIFGSQREIDEWVREQGTRPPE